MSQTSIKNEPKVAQDSENQKPPPPPPNESFEKPTPSQKRKSESLLDNSDSMETSQTNISPGSNGSSSNLATGREKRIRKAKAYDDDFLMYDIPSCSNSTLFQSLAKQMQPAAQEQQAVEVKFNLGDLVWAKVSGHPWWPCIISNPDLSTLNSLKNYNEPKNENSHFKLIGGSRPKRSYYVEFFGPSIEHAWVPEGNILEYKGIDAFKSFSQQQIDQANTRHAKERQTEKYALKITLPKREHWDQAISEADGLMNKKPRDRKLYFIKKHTNEDQEVKSEPVADEEEDQASEGVKVTKVKRESIESNADSVQNEGKKPCAETRETTTSELTEDYFIDTSETKLENPLKLSEQSSSTKTDEFDDKVILTMASKFEDENLESPNADSYLTDRYRNAAYHIKQGLSIDEVCNKYRISKSALIKYLERGTAPRGKKTRLTEYEERELVDWLISFKELKYCDAINIVFDKVISMFEEESSERKNPFPNGKPSVDWWYDFLSRHPQIMASKPDWIKRGKINDKYIQDVQSGQLKCTKFRRALLSAIQYIRKIGEQSMSLSVSTKSYDENSQESVNKNASVNGSYANSRASRKKSNEEKRDDVESNDSVLSVYDSVEYSLNSGLPDDDINKLLDSLVSDESEFIDTFSNKEEKYEMKYLFVNNDDEDEHHEYDLNQSNHSNLFKSKV